MNKKMGKKGGISKNGEKRRKSKKINEKRRLEKY